MIRQIAPQFFTLDIPGTLVGSNANNIFSAAASSIQ
jgi:hypothetical protein